MSRDRKQLRQVRRLCLLLLSRGIVSNFPRELLRNVWHFILHGGQVTCEVPGKRKLGNGLKWLESIVRYSSCSEIFFCWFGINSFYCHSRTSQPSGYLPSCNLFASSLELELFHLTSAAAVVPRPHHAHDSKFFWHLLGACT